MGLIKIGIATVVCAVTMSCARPANVHNAEIEARASTYQPSAIKPALAEGKSNYLDLKTLYGASRYATNLADVYLQQAAEAGRAQDAAALGVIAAAIVAAGGAIFEAHADVLKAAGYAAGSIGVANQYYDPKKTVNDLLTASEQALCIASAGWEGNRDLGKIEKETIRTATDAAAAPIVATGLASVRLILRRNLQRENPNYSTYIDQIVAAAKVAPSEEDYRSKVDEAADQEKSDAIIKKLKLEVPRCLPK